MVNKLLAIGEALIDFIPTQTGVAMKDVNGFEPKVGGAPANVCGAFTKLGGDAAMITQLGMDPFGDKIIEEFMQYGIGTEYIKRTSTANTSLAFVALMEDGNREFAFFRSPGADMLLTGEDLEESWFKDTFALHYCSVSLGDFPMKEAHKKAIEYARAANSIISFDPNVRLMLWNNPEQLRKVILEFMPLSHIIKISDEELEFITGKTSIEKAKEILFTGDTKLILYTKGSGGAEAYTKAGYAAADSHMVQAVDTTGAGDGFIGSFLYQLAEDGVTAETLERLSAAQLTKYLEFSHRFCAKSVQIPGAIASYPTKEEL